MSETKHTPGPWFAKGRYIGTKNHMSAIGECRDINGNWSDDVKASANARLIAAAPELLEALKVCATLINVQNGNLHQDVNAILEMARLAIVKAETSTTPRTDTTAQEGRD